MTSQPTTSRAFTLVEVMISVVLVLIVVFGVSQVFTMSAQTVGAGQALSSITRDNRAAQSTMAEDFRSVAADTPIFIMINELAYHRENITDKVFGVKTATSTEDIVRGRRAGFFNSKAEQADADGDPFTHDGNGDGNENEIIPLLQTSDRNPRLDRLGFFVRGRFSKQTEPAGGRNPKALVPTAGEAFVWYGHLMLDQPAGYPPLPPNSQFGEQRVLGRACILLRDDPSLAASEVRSETDTTPRPRILPFYPSDPRTDIRSGRDDLVGLTINTVREKLNTRMSSKSPSTSDVLWYQPFWDTFSTGGTMTVPYRFMGQPKLTKLADATGKLDVGRMIAELSQTNNTFLPTCTQFIVEYAGDYLYQDENGALIDPPGAPSGTTGVAQFLKQNVPDIQYGQTDGQIDFVVDQNIIDPVTNKPAKRIRWYGMPRDVTGPQPNPVNGNLESHIDIDDVVPLSYMLNYDENGDKIRPNRFKSKYKRPAGNTLCTAPWEENLYPTFDFDYLNVAHKINNSPNPKSHSYARYATIFREGQIPKMLRITMKLDDPGQRLQEGQWIQYILTR